MLDTYWCNEQQTQEDFFNKIYTSHFIARVRKRVVQGLCVRGSWRSNITAIFWPPNLWPSTLCLSRSSDAQPEPWGSTLLGAGFLYCILSASSLDPNSSGLPKGPFSRVWLPLPHLVSNSVRSSTLLPLARQTQLSYIIVRRPLDLWNWMFNRHQAKIIVMQFRGHSLPVHHSVVAQWDLHLVPYYQP